VLPGGNAPSEADPFQALRLVRGESHLLAEHTAIALAPEKAAPPIRRGADPVSQRQSWRHFPAPKVALTTGSALTGARLPVGEAIDRAVTMVRGNGAARGVSVDEVTAALITSRFDIRREGEKLLVYDERFSLDPTRAAPRKADVLRREDRELSMLESDPLRMRGGGRPEGRAHHGQRWSGKSRVRHGAPAPVYAPTPSCRR